MIWLKSGSSQAMTIAFGVAQFGRFGVVFLEFFFCLALCCLRHTFGSSWVIDCCHVIRNCTFLCSSNVLPARFCRRVSARARAYARQFGFGRWRHHWWRLLILQLWNGTFHFELWTLDVSLGRLSFSLARWKLYVLLAVWTAVELALVIDVWLGGKILSNSR